LFRPRQRAFKQFKCPRPQCVNVYVPPLQTKLEELKTRIYRGACKSAHDISRNCVRSFRSGWYRSSHYWL